MSLSNRSSEIIPFSLTEIFVLLAFLLLLLLEVVKGNSARASDCIDRLNDDQKCVAVDKELELKPGEQFAPVPEEVAEDSTITAVYGSKEDIEQWFECNPDEEPCFLESEEMEPLEECLKDLKDGQICQPMDSDMRPVPKELAEEIEKIEERDLDPMALLLGPNEMPGACWRDSNTNDIVYALTVIKEPNHLEITPSWTPEFRAAAATVPQLRELAQASSIDYDRYAELASPILEWSIDQDEDPDCVEQHPRGRNGCGCRLYVDIYHRDASWVFLGGETLSGEREDQIEQFFYKRINSRPLSSP